MDWTPSTLTPGLQGGPKEGWWGSGASAMHFGGQFFKQKSHRAPNLVGVGHLFGPQIQIQKGPCLVCFWSHGPSFSRRVYNTKVVADVPNSFLVLTQNSFILIVHDQKDRALGWKSLQGPGRLMSGYLHILQSSN